MKYYKSMAKFKNEHGEEFTFLFDGLTVSMKGDETDDELISLFNEDFNIYSKEELVTIGKILQGFGENNGSK